MEHYDVEKIRQIKKPSDDTISVVLFQDLRKYHIDFCESANNF